MTRPPLALLFGVLMLALGACRAAPAPTADATVVRMAWTDVGPPTPFRVSTVGPGGPALLSLMYDTLTWKDENGIIPWLAADWAVSADGRTWDFTLRQGVTWQDGQVLTAHDVAFSFAYYAKNPYRWMPTDMVDSATAVTDTSVRIALKSPYPAFLEGVAGVVPIIPQHVWEQVTDPTHYAGPDAYLGSGPYRLAEYSAGSGAYRLVANPMYFKGKPRIAEFQQVDVPAETMLDAVRQGRVDMAWTTDAGVLDAVSGGRGVSVIQTAPLSVVRLVLNTEQAPLDRVEVRRALAFALRRDLLAQTVTRGDPVVGSFGVIPPETPWFAPSVQQYDFDPSRARELLGGQHVSFELLANPEYREPELIRPMLEDVGISVSIRHVDGPGKAQLLRARQFQAAELQHIGIGGDPDFLRRWYCGTEGNQSAQGDILHDPTFAELAQQQLTAPDPATRKALVARLQETLAEHVPTIPLFYRRFYWVYATDRVQPMNTSGGLMNGVPFVTNKLIFLSR
ncbi:MAG: ABC transporter substrate-binding protein [Chloroflexota bacterium]